MFHRGHDFDGHQVVVKFMSDQIHQVTENRGREKLNNSEHIVGIVEQSVRPDLTDSQFRADAEALGYHGYVYGVVMPALERNWVEY